MNVLDVLKGIWEASGFAALTWKQAVMIGFSFLFIINYPAMLYRKLHFHIISK